jgi:hypothetical protein
MRTLSFRDILWEVAYRMGLDPTSDLLTDQAVALGFYINSVVRQEWHAADWPEWTYTQPRTPDTRHIVNFKAPVIEIPDVDSRIGRVLKVYLNDPELVQPPLEIAHRLTSDGVHVGFEHGSQVWVKFQPPAPLFTAFPWNGARTYGQGELIYSPVSGQCYESKSNGNLNHNPAGDRGVDPPPLTVEMLQPYRPDSPGFEEQSQITRIDVDFQDAHVIDSISTISIQLIGGGLGSPPVTVNHTAISGETVADVVDALVAALTAAPTLSGLTITSDTGSTPPTITLEANLNFAVTQARVMVPHELTIYFPVVALQTYVPPVPFVPGQPQVDQLKLADTQALPGATYNLLFHDLAGAAHLLSYVNPDRNAAADVLQGIVLELQFLKHNDPDPFWLYLTTIMQPDTLTLLFSAYTMFSLDATMVPAGSPWWRVVHFPLALADSVIRGAKASMLSEQGQVDKANSEEQLAGQMAVGQLNTLEPHPFNTLTDQTKPSPRYRIGT